MILGIWGVCAILEMSFLVKYYGDLHSYENVTKTVVITDIACGFSELLFTLLAYLLLKMSRGTKGDREVSLLVYVANDQGYSAQS